MPKEVVEALFLFAGKTKVQKIYNRAFVTFGSKEEAAEAKEVMNGKGLGNTRMAISFAMSAEHVNLVKTQMKAQERRRLQYRLNVFIPGRRILVYNVPEIVAGKVKREFMNRTGNKNCSMCVC